MNLLVDRRLDVSERLQAGVDHHRAGRPDEARQIYTQILAVQPENPDALHLMGMLYVEKGDHRAGRKLIRRAIESDDRVAIFYVSLGNSYQTEDRFDEAVECYRNALRLDPNSVEALCNLGNTLREQKNYSAAINCYQRCLEINSHLPEVYNNLGLAHQNQDNLAAAQKSLQRAIELRPEYAEAHNNLADVYRQQSNFDEALQHYRRAFSLMPTNAAIAFNLGLILQLQNDAEGARKFYQTAIDLDPGITDAHINLGKMLQDANALESAIAHFSKAIDIDPANADAHFNRSLALLALGKFEAGWREYEWRFKRSGWKRIYPHRLKGQRWDGRPFDGQTLLVHSEQGYGDTIWLVRYLPLVKSLGGTVIFEVQPELYELLQGVPGVDQMVTMSFDRPPQMEYDLHVPLMSLPAIFSTTLENIPGTVPYLQAPAPKRNFWRQRINGDDFKIGLTWAAKASYRHFRSCPLEFFRPLFNIKNFTIYGLQKGDGVQQTDLVSWPVNNPGESFESFADTAGAIDCLDLVISVDTVVAHLAGAMGKPVWLLLPYAPDWKWMLNRMDSPWYPTLRLFRQGQPGEWQGVIDSVLDELCRLFK